LFRCYRDYTRMMNATMTHVWSSAGPAYA